MAPPSSSKNSNRRDLPCPPERSSSRTAESKHLRLIRKQLLPETSTRFQAQNLVTRVTDSTQMNAYCESWRLRERVSRTYWHFFKVISQSWEFVRFALALGAEPQRSATPQS